MDLPSFFDLVLVEIAGVDIVLGRLLLTLVLVGVLIQVYRYVYYKFYPALFEREEVVDRSQRRMRRLTYSIFLLLLALIIMMGLGIDPIIEYYTYKTKNTPQQIKSIPIKPSIFIIALLIFLLARLVDYIAGRVLIPSYYQRRESDQVYSDRPRRAPDEIAGRTIQFLVYALALIFFVNNFGLDFVVLPGGKFGRSITFSNILSAVAVLMAARLLVWLVINIVLFGYYSRRNIPAGSQYAINRLLKYVAYVFSALIALQVAGINLTLFLGGAAALLVGIGLGLQQFFQDLISGVILLFERTVEVEDVVEKDGLVGTIKSIGLRTSLIETRDNITVIVPNSELVTNNVINWSHYDTRARFHISVGVAYGSDMEKVRELLLEVAKLNPNLLRNPEPFVRFINFGDSSLDLELHFWSHELVRIEDVKSDLRFGIDATFRKHDVSIPFPQRDVWMKGEQPS